MARPISKKAPAPAKPLRLLIADDDPDDVDLCLRNLKKSGIKFQADTVSTRKDFARTLREQPVDIVIADYRMKDWSGMDALALVKEIRPNVPLILLSGTLGDEMAVACIKMGVTDYVLKNQLARLPMALQRAQEEKSLREAEIGAAKALRESQVSLALAQRITHLGSWELDLDDMEHLDRNPLRWSDEVFRIFGSEPGAIGVSNESFFSFVHPGDREVVRRAVAGAIRSGQPFSIDHRIVRRDGAERVVHEQSEILRDPQAGHMQKMVGTIHDITDRKRAEEALRESEARYRGLVNNATYGIYWVTPQGELLFVNPALVHMLGYESADDLLAVKNTKAIYCDPDVRDKVLAEYNATRCVDATVGWKRKDGKTIIVHINGWQAKAPERGTDCVEVIVEDVTQRTALEKQLVQAQQFEAIGQLAGGIAHDFNNMIGAILGWADMGIDETEAGSRLHRHFEKVRQQAERAAALTRQLLAFARRQILEPRNMDLNLTVVETLSLLEKVIGSNIEIKANLAPKLAVVRADPTQIEQVLMNLCINARDAMSEGGSLTVDTSNIALDEHFCALQPLAHPGEYAMLSVTDTGTGMDSAILDRIFEPFFTTKELGKGTGLGLATVYGIVIQHGGFVQVYSELGRGSTFRVYLPVSTVATVSPERVEDSQPVRGGSETILVAEDHDGLRQLAAETLTNLGYHVVLAVDGEQAVRAFLRERDRIDLALLDVVLPKLSGPEIYERICKEKPDVPVIFATGYSADIALLHNVQQRGLPVLQKPYSPRDLARKVRETLDHRARLLTRA